MTATDATHSMEVGTDRARQELLRVARDLFAHADAVTMPLADEVLELPASEYTDPELFEREVQGIFRRLPLMLAASCEIPGAGDKKAIDVAGVPVVLVRGRDGVARAFLNVCTHRGAIVSDGCGSAARMVCPYHGWTFDDRGSTDTSDLDALFGS